MNRLKIVRQATFIVALLWIGQAVLAQESPNAAVVEPLTRPRIINTTDLGADPDDEQSMVRQLVCANEFDIEGLIVSTSCWKKSQTDTKMLENGSQHGADEATPVRPSSVSPRSAEDSADFG